MPDSLQLSNFNDWYTDKVQRSQAWFVTKTPLLDSLGTWSEGEEVDQRGMRWYFMKEEAGGHSFPTTKQPSFNAPKLLQSDSMYARAMMYALPLIAEYRMIRDAMSGKETVRIKLADILKHYTEIGAQQQEYFACGDGRGVLAFGNSNLAVGANQTLNCESNPSTEPGHTKGAVRLRKNQIYQSFDQSTGLAEGTIKVTKQGKTSCTVTVMSGITTAGNPICHVNGFNKAPRGLTHLFGNHPRILQGRDTSVDDVMNCPTLDKVNTRLTIPDRNTAKTILVTYQNDSNARANLTWVTIPGIMTDLENQQYGFGRKTMNERAQDQAHGYKDADGATILEIANFDDDVHMGFLSDHVKKLNEMEWGEIDLDALMWRMLPGDNQSGSILFNRSWGCIWSLASDDFRSSVVIKRCSVSGITRQVTTGV